MRVQKFLALTAALVLAGLGETQIAGAVEEGAKGLYFAQLEQPKEKLNTGVQYWIELHRQGQKLSVTNKYAFKSGDRIKFHVRANIDGFAYILLKTGSRGERAVLFPEGREDNRVARGKDYSIPREDFLSFDSNPGTERVTLLLSRTPLDADAYLRQVNQEVTVIGSAADGSKDLVPSKILLAVSPPATAPVEERDEPGATRAAPSRQPDQVKQPDVTKKKLPQQAIAARPRKKPAQTAIAARPPASAPVKVASSSASGSEPQPAGPHGGLVTIVQRDPATVLAVDVDLDHSF